MKSFSLPGTRVLALAAACALSSCGGEGGDIAMSNASATNVRYAQTLTLTFTGQGFDKGVEVAVDGPCDNLTRLPGSNANGVQYTCVISGVGRINSVLRATDGGQAFGSLKVDVPLPRVSLTVTDGTRTGTLLLELDPAAAPASVAQFVAYANAGFYTGTLFHRVRPDTAILAGGFTSGTEGVISAKLTTRGDVALERTGLKNLRGSVALYREAALNSANSMFFINTVDNPRFDVGSAETPDGYAVFGKVVEGLDVVDEIAKVPVRPDLSLAVNDVPVTAVRISAAAQTR